LPITADDEGWQWIKIDQIPKLYTGPALGVFEVCVSRPPLLTWLCHCVSDMHFLAEESDCL